MCRSETRSRTRPDFRSSSRRTSTRPSSRSSGRAPARRTTTSRSSTLAPASGSGWPWTGEVVRGATGNAGDGGTIHVSHADLPPRRRSDMIGHLATPQYLVSQAAELGALETAPDLHDLAAVDDAYSELVRRAGSRRGSRRSRSWRGRPPCISAALVSVVNLLDIDEIVFGGPAWARAAPLMRSEIVARINELLTGAGRQASRDRPRRDRRRGCRGGRSGMPGPRPTPVAPSVDAPHRPRCRRRGRGPRSGSRATRGRADRLIERAARRAIRERRA